MTNQTQTIVEFDQHHRLWLVKNGRLATFPAGREGWHKAMLLALWHDHRALSEVVKDIIKAHRDDVRVDLDTLTNRLLRASQLVLSGNVCRGVEVSTVTSQSNPDVHYHVIWQGYPTQPACTCADYSEGGTFSYYGSVCKHILAALLVYFLGETEPDVLWQQVPSSGEDQDQQSKSIWDMVSELIDSDGITAAPGKEQLIWQSGQARVTILRRSTDDRLMLVARNGHVTTSKPIAYWGRDYGHISGPKGMWKLCEDAQVSYLDFVQRAQR